MSKLVKSLEDVIKECNLQDGMCIAFHHHLRNGDYVMPLVLNTINRMGFKDIKVSSSGIMDQVVDNNFIEMVRSGVITSVDTTGNSQILGRLISNGKFKDVSKFRTHGGRPGAMLSGDLKIDISFVAASAADYMGNCNGMDGLNAFGSLGYAMTSSRYADKVVVITDNLVKYPLERTSLDETYVDYVVVIDSIGDPKGIATGIVKPTKDPIALKIAEYAAETIKYSALFKDGFSFQAGAGGASAATTKNLKKMMEDNKIHGSFILGGITGNSVDLLESGLFDTILDVQSFDQIAVSSLLRNSNHQEISDSKYANPFVKSCVVDNLDVVVLGALEVDTKFNVNLVVNSSGYISGGSGGHGDASAGSKLSIIVVPLFRTRYPSIVEKVRSITTPGKDINVVVTQYGVAVNPNNPELKLRLKDGGIKLVEIENLQKMAQKITGTPKEIKYGDRLVAEVVHRDGTIIDRIYNILQK